MMRIGIDTGGTFTDFVFFDDETGAIEPLKLPSTPENPARAILEGLDAYMDGSFELIHGTTVSTNAFLQKKMAKTAFVCTKGFEHILHIGRQNRTELFSLEVKKPTSIVPLSLCYGVHERTLKDGTVVKEPEEPEVIQLAESLREQEVESIGIVFLHSYRNPQNEQLAAAILRDYGFYVTASHEIMPEYREYERSVVTILNAALKPVIADYVDNLKEALAGKKLSIIQSNGGILSPDRIINEPVRTIMSGPAGGVIAAQKIAGLTGDTNLVTLDMGGTSTDVSVIKNGEIILTREGAVEYLPLRFPMIDIVTVGAGGGSIARVDRGGVLQVGPESAGADPGPACYGSDDNVTVTDAFVVTGAVLPEMFLGGKMKIFPKRSVKAVKRISEEIGKSLYETAEGIIRISVSTMERALRSVTLEKGEDPRFYTLMPFGGAGGLVAALLADRLGMQRILVPPNQGVFSALGMLVADVKKELSHSFLKMVSPGIDDEWNAAFLTLEQEVRQILYEEGFPEPQILEHLDMRYKGQSYELTVPYSRDFLKAFHQMHQQYYSYSLTDEHCEIVNLRVVGIGKTPEFEVEKKPIIEEDAKVFYRKQVYFNGGSQNFYIYSRSELMPGHRLKNPCIIAADDSTVIVPGTFEASVDPYANIILTAKPDRKRR
ncbi:MAG: hydantoinase/oxoprolinase family protein [Candidatus Aminicenantes bacterium]|nr:hydantoinase/oxoprolinase family protein [Candidatus Aminicenantes bacterium]NIM80388.1 hydantoinase/oxoprolinase family protein [Candidatus Aminicenantes bacterium]NIN19775.1 hydantoinase/oxoprolinase family protein [Candidatus Aminicenantes bacterium]NIN43657.1 hydantoinase/oxoprolinase family protein [Candidatus Aminicenantes bacterium]NIN86402.1 hydantoinase/oxoprolinase family protein [Candidatus Aminicenantes bacterium]